MQTNRISRRTIRKRKKRPAGGRVRDAIPRPIETRRFLYLHLLLEGDSLGAPSNAAYEGSLLSEEQEEFANGSQNDLRHLLSALQFPQERQSVFVNRRSARVHNITQEGA
jgi:hypothetical protein